jgi:hypothetical protein
MVRVTRLIWLPTNGISNGGILLFLIFSYFELPCLPSLLLVSLMS